MEVIIVDENDKTRIDSYLADKTEYSRVTIQRLIDEQKITVNGKKVKSSYKVQQGDSIKIEKEEPKEVELKAQDIPLDILYEDDDIIVVNKPKGMVVHPANGNPDGTLVNAIMSICKESLSGIGGALIIPSSTLSSFFISPILAFSLFMTSIIEGESPINYINKIKLFNNL